MFFNFLTAFPKFRASASYETDYVLDQYDFLTNIRIYKTNELASENLAQKNAQ